VATAWLIEGLLAYLSPEEADRLLGIVAELSAPGSQVAFEQGPGVSPALLERAQTIPSMARYTSLFRGGLGEDEVGWLERHNWHASAHDRFALAASYGRTPPSGTDGGFVTATRRPAPER
jgi:O-methyltransferase involved in polyketide biosynthesis